jgi:hypothetical protein
MIKKIKEKHLDSSLFMVQTFLGDYSLEVGILYEKYPWNNTGNIIEMVEKTNKNNIKTYDSINRVDQTIRITEKLKDTIGKLSDNIPNFYVGRYDIRFRNFEELLNDHFKIVEVNGTMGMELTCETFNFCCFLNDFYWVLRRLGIGSYNILTLKGYSPWNLIWCMYKSFISFLTCNDWENLFSLYS